MDYIDLFTADCACISAVDVDDDIDDVEDDVGRGWLTKVPSVRACNTLYDVGMIYWYIWNNMHANCSLVAISLSPCELFPCKQRPQLYQRLWCN